MTGYADSLMKVHQPKTNLQKLKQKKTPIKYSRAVSRYSIGFFLVRYKVVTTWIDTCILSLYTCVYASSKVKIVKQRFSQKNLTWEDGICVCHNTVNLWLLYIVSAKDFKFRPTLCTLYSSLSGIIHLFQGKLITKRVICN